MASADVVSGKHVLKEPDFVPRKRFKTSELPLNATQKSTIDGLLHTIKKKGEYDSLRKKVWSQFEESAEKTAFTDRLHELAEAEIERDPSLLSRERGKAATLMSGVVDRSDIYKSVEAALDALISKNINHILQAGREIRQTEVGEEVAAAEEKRGNKTDEEYAKEAAVRREERARERKRDEARKRREDEIERLRAEEAKHKREIEKLQSQNERRKEREAARAERERLAEERRQRDKPKDDPVVEKEKENSMNKVEESEAVTPTTVAPPMDNKALEEAALALLLQEGRELAAKNGPPKPEPELSDSEIPHRKQHVSPPKGPAAERNKVPPKPRLGYSSTPLHQSSGTPIPPYTSSGTPRSRSPHRTSLARHDRSQSPDYSRRPSRSYSYRDEDARIQTELDHKAIYKAQMQARRDSEAEAFKRRGRSDRDDGENQSRSPSRTTERDHGRDKDRDKDRERERERGKRYDHEYDYDYDYDYSREQSRPQDERPRSRDRERERHRYDEREKPYTRPRREEAPEHIDRYVPGGAAPAREKRRSTLENGVDRDDKEKHGREDTRDRDASHKDRDRDRNRDRDRDGSYRDSKRDYRERGSYHHDRDRHRDRDDYDRDRYRDREHHHHHRDHKDRDRDRDRGEEKGRGYERESHRDGHRDRDRDGREERPYTRPRREPAPENIDRYVPGAD